MISFRRALVTSAISVLIVAGGPVPAAAPVLPHVADHLAVVRAAQAVALQNARSKGERELIKAELDFAADAQRRHVSEAFIARVAPDAVLIGQGDPVVIGAEAVGAEMRKSKASWHWSPIAARVNGDLGVTWGIAAVLYVNKEGQQTSIQTRYVTVWQRRARRWRIWLDTGNAGPATTELLDSPFVQSARRT